MSKSNKQMYLELWTYVTFREKDLRTECLLICHIINEKFIIMTTKLQGVTFLETRVF